MLAKFDGSRFRQTDDCVFAGDVDLDAWKRGHTKPRGRIYNGPASRLEHRRDLMPHAQPHALHVDVHDLVIGLHLLFEERRQQLLDTRVVESEVEPAELLQRAPDEIFDLRFLRHIGRHEHGFAALRADEPNGFLAFRSSAAGNNHLGPFPGVGDGGGAADS